MNQTELQKLLAQFKNGQIGEKEIMEVLKSSVIHSMEFANIDHHRELRQGFPEVIFCEGKSTDHILSIAEKIYEHHGKLLATRATPEVYEVIGKSLPNLEYNAAGRCIHSPFPDAVPGSEGHIAVITAGTSDVPVAEETAVTCSLFGFRPARVFDVGVAGLHRLNHHWESVRAAKVVIVIAGMEGALPSVIGGLVDKPVIAVPTSVGYGTSFGGLTALFGMLNSCSSNVVVVNIDNGFGAGFTAGLMLRQIAEARQKP